MSEWNPWENRLRSWTPRSPSAKLKARLFQASQEPLLDSFSPFGGRWAWLAPVMGCFLVLLVISGTHANHLAYLGTASSTDWPTTVAGNQSYAAYIAAGFHSEQNALKSDRMELSLGTPAPAILPVEPSQITNSLIR